MFHDAGDGVHSWFMRVSFIGRSLALLAAGPSLSWLHIRTAEICELYRDSRRRTCACRYFLKHIKTTQTTARPSYHFLHIISFLLLSSYHFLVVGSRPCGAQTPTPTDCPQGEAGPALLAISPTDVKGLGQSLERRQRTGGSR